MKKTVIKTVNAGKRSNQPAKTKETYYQLPVNKISFSPLNYRKTYDHKSLEEFAGQLAKNGLLAPVVVRPGKRNSYELVVGERRLRAAQLAGLKTLPARIEQLTDDEVIETQLVENLQRENPHPVHEAQAVLRLQQTGKTIEEIAAQLGKSQAFVYNRLKLSAMIEPFKEMFIAGKMSIRYALELASLVEDSQTAIFEQNCTDWKTDRHFSIDHVIASINRYKYDLKKAPFNTRDKTLVPVAGACTGCPFNSATLKTLFPEISKEAVCSNKTCFKSKCHASAEREILQTIESFQPDTIIVDNYPDQQYLSVVDEISDLRELTRHNHSDVTIIKNPIEPDKSNFNCWNKSETKLIFDRNAYKQALEDYKNDIAEYELEVQKSTTLRAIYISSYGIKAVYVNPFVRNAAKNGGAAKDFQEALKQGKVTTELLTNEISRINDRERRAKELDTEKVQVKIHEQFSEALQKPTLKKQLLNADKIAVRFIVFEALDYGSKSRVEKKLCPKGESTNEQFFEALSKMKDEQFAAMIRTVVCSKGESKNPNSLFAYCLNKIASEAGLNLSIIEKEQTGKASQRETRIRIRVKDLQKQIKRLTFKKAA